MVVLVNANPFVWMPHRLLNTTYYGCAGETKTVALQAWFCITLRFDTTTCGRYGKGWYV